MPHVSLRPLELAPEMPRDEFLKTLFGNKRRLDLLAFIGNHAAGPADTHPFIGKDVCRQLNVSTGRTVYRELTNLHMLGMIGRLDEPGGNPLDGFRLARISTPLWNWVDKAATAVNTLYPADTLLPAGSIPQTPLREGKRTGVTQNEAAAMLFGAFNRLKVMHAIEEYYDDDTPFSLQELVDSPSWQGEQRSPVYNEIAHLRRIGLLQPYQPIFPQEGPKLWYTKSKEEMWGFVKPAMEALEAVFPKVG